MQPEQALSDHRSMLMPKYSITPPKYFRDQAVEFMDYKCLRRRGCIKSVHTTYDHMHQASHYYLIIMPGERGTISRDESQILGPVDLNKSSMKDLCDAK